MAESATANRDGFRVASGLVPARGIYALRAAIVLALLLMFLTPYVLIYCSEASLGSMLAWLVLP